MSTATESPGPESDQRIRRVAIIGDSVIAGLGARGRAFSLTVATRLGVEEPLNLARSTYTVEQTLEQLAQLREYAPDLVMVGIGGADGLVHTSKLSQTVLDRIAPKSWQGVEGLEPRAYYSSDAKKARKQKLTSKAKVAVKRVILTFSKGFQRVPLEEFDKLTAQLFDALEQMGSIVIVMGIVNSDPKNFPRTASAMLGYRKSLARLSAGRPKFRAIDPREVLVCWDDYLEDHTHLTAEAHDKVADLIFDRAGDLLGSGQ